MQGIVINGLSQTASSTGLNIAGGSISGATSRGVDINNASANISIGADISTSGSVRSVEVTNSGAAAGNSITFSGNVTDTGAGINLDDNDQNGGNATVSFTGGLTLNTSANAAFSATNGGIVQATGASNTVTTTTGRGVNIDNTTIGAAGFALRSVSVNGAVNGIRLNNTGDTGGVFTVTGDGTKARNGSGGTIQSTTGDGIELTNAFNVTLQSLNIISVGDGTTDGTNGGNTLSTSDHAIQSEDSGDIILSGVHIQAPQGSGWEAVNLTGVNRIDSNSLFEGINTSNYQALEVRNTDASPASFTIDGSTFKDQATTNGSSYVVFSSFGTSNLDITIENNSIFENIFGYAVQSNAGEDTGGSGTVSTTIRGSTFQNAAAGTVGVGASGGIGGIIISAREECDGDFRYR